MKKHLRASSSRLPIFISFQILIVAVFLEKLWLTEGCYKTQECYTPLNVIGFYYTQEDMQRLTEKQKTQCDGHCQDGNNTLTCCAFGGRPEKHRLLYQCGFDLNSTTATDYDIDQIIEHPNYEYPALYNDIALIRMTKEFLSGTPIVAKACIWYGSLAEEQLTAIGYGDTQFAGASSPLLMKTNLSAITNEECSTYYEQDEDLLSSGVIATQLCAKDHAKLRDTCQGDSGGPLIRYGHVEDYLPIAYIVGVNSFGIGCGTGARGIYTRVSEYFDWIEEQVYK